MSPYREEPVELRLKKVEARLDTVEARLREADAKSSGYVSRLLNQAECAAYSRDNGAHRRIMELIRDLSR